MMKKRSRLHDVIDLTLSFFLIFFFALTILPKVLIAIFPNPSQALSTVLCVGCILTAIGIALKGYRKLNTILHYGMFRSSI